MLEKPAATAVPIHDLLARRWSPRAFDAGRAVSREQTLALLEAARWAPSCFNDQPWRFVVWDRHGDPASWQQGFDCLAASNQAWVKNAALLIAVGAERAFRHNGKDNRWGMYDAGAAATSLCLQAVALGLAAHQMGGFDAARVAASAGLPETVTPMAMIAVGYQAAPEALPPELAQREAEPRTRRALAEWCFDGHWDRPLDPKMSA